MKIGTAAGGSLDSDDVLLGRGSFANDDLGEFTDWVLVKESHGQKVYNRYARPDSDVPMLKVDGVIEAPYSNVVAIVWDENYAYPDFISPHLVTARRLESEVGARHDLYIYRMPLMSRFAVWAGSL